MKQFICVVLSFIFALFTARPVIAETVPIAGHSASLMLKNAGKPDVRPDRVRRFLVKYNSPLIPHAKLIVELADKYEIDWRLVTAISGVESTFCKAIPYNSYNCWGWRNGDHYFKNYSDALEIVSKALGNNYYKKGLKSPEAIARVYAPPSTAWARNVRFFMNLFEDNISSSLLAQQFSI